MHYAAPVAVGATRPDQPPRSLCVVPSVPFVPSSRAHTRLHVTRQRTQDGTDDGTVTQRETFCARSRLAGRRRGNPFARDQHARRRVCGMVWTITMHGSYVRRSNMVLWEHEHGLVSGSKRNLVSKSSKPGYQLPNPMHSAKLSSFVFALRSRSEIHLHR